MAAVDPPPYSRSTETRETLPVPRRGSNIKPPVKRSRSRTVIMTVTAIVIPSGRSHRTLPADKRRRARPRRRTRPRSRARPAVRGPFGGALSVPRGPAGSRVLWRRTVGCSPPTLVGPAFRLSLVLVGSRMRHESVEAVRMLRTHRARLGHRARGFIASLRVLPESRTVSP